MPTAGGGGFSPIAGGTYQPSTVQIGFLKYFQNTNMSAACPECGCSRIECERLRAPPELLLLHVNRIDLVRGQAQKIKRRVHFSKDILLDKALFDQRLGQQGAGNPVDDAPYNYELFWVGLHQGETHDSGHYHCYAKGRRDWAFLDDLHTGLLNENQFGNFQAETQAYIFAYRRVVPGDVQEDPELVSPVRKPDDGAMDFDPKETPAGGLSSGAGLQSGEAAEERDKIGRLELRFTDSDGNVLQSTDLVGIPYNSPAGPGGQGLYRVSLPGDKTGTMTLQWYDHANYLVESCSMEGLLKDLMIARAKSRSRSRSREKKEDDKPDEKPECPPSTRSSPGRKLKDILTSPAKILKGDKKKKNKKDKKDKKSKKGKKDEKCEEDAKDENC
ncbi:hypothetical protein N7493_000682 [Penicillium malachiteum]|uniref:USP domain-containing protein n=1 Tax=Penicillium malachiteum TaxID=1324776 RepID=A0AAD6HWW5_9EURO|nr:hypothetical protein N7493_000682 [Penicillium malachiteum]